MAEKSAQAIYEEILAHMGREGGEASTWYVGITSDVEERLFGAHRVPKANHWFIWKHALSSAEARLVEQALLEFGCDGGPGGGDDTCRFVYAYLKTSITDP